VSIAVSSLQVLEIQYLRETVIILSPRPNKKAFSAESGTGFFHFRNVQAPRLSIPKMKKARQ
jgi:hypothetical protein